MTDLITTSVATDRLIEFVKWRKAAVLSEPLRFWPWWRPCTVKMLLVTDGILNFGPGDFGLSTLVDALIHDQRSYVRFELTLAHRRAVAPSAVMSGAAGVAASITSFRFDQPAHFDPDRFDVVWLFGIEQFPSQQLDPAEVANLVTHMQNRRGVFATGDHGPLGAALCDQLPRVSSMRYWSDFTSPAGPNEVGMTQVRRNDSNQPGHDPGSQFSDQSDDIPQPLDLKLYSTWGKWWQVARWPHPLMCSRLGRIDVFPDHPHEGECRVPTNLTATVAGVDEYPGATDGSGPVSPEVVAWGRVRAGNNAVVDNSATKAPTAAQTYGVVATYDGHRADVGRVVCDSTWHHFVNVNLIGILEGGDFDDFPGAPGGGTPGTHASKHVGFLYSPAGQAALSKIREYFVNIGVWLAPPERHACFNNRFWFDIVWAERVVEAALTWPGQAIDELSVADLFHVGIHARDVIGRRAGVCQSLGFRLMVLDMVDLDLRPHIDPWWPWPRRQVDGDPPLPWTDLEPVADVAIGAAVVAVHREFPTPVDNPEEIMEKVVSVARQGAQEGARRALQQLGSELRLISRAVTANQPRLDN